MTIRPMRPDEEPQVRVLYHRCHPDSGPLPAPWFHVIPTLVLEVEGEMVATTSFTISPDATRGYVAYGFGLCVHPDHRGKGYAKALHDARCRMAREVGAIDFLGTVAPDNAPMVHVLQAAGGRHIGSAENCHFYVERL